MMKLLFATMLFLVCSCSNNKTTQETNTPADSTHKTVQTDSNLVKTDELKGDSTYAYITNAFMRNDSAFIAADYIQFFTGDAALAAAQKNHEADTIRDANGKIKEIFVPNDYYIVNESKKIRELTVSKTAEVIIQKMDGQVTETKTSLNKYISNHDKSLFPAVLYLRNNQVLKIREVYVP